MDTGKGRTHLIHGDMRLVLFDELCNLEFLLLDEGRQIAHNIGSIPFPLSGDSKKLDGIRKTAPQIIVNHFPTQNAQPQCTWPLSCPTLVAFLHAPSTSLTRSSPSLTILRNSSSRTA